MEDTRKIIALGAGPIRGLSADRIFTDDLKDFDGDTMILRPRKTAEDHPHTRHHTGVAKDRRLARKKRAKKLSRRR